MKFPVLLSLLMAVQVQAAMLVEVDRTTQTIKVKTPRGDWEDKVSTGGGLKLPNGVERKDKSPYCANQETPDLNQVYIAAAESGPDRTMEPVHFSNTFSDQKGNKIAMPWAISLGGGIYFHEAPPSYLEFLGKNVSGGCIRLPPGRAEQLYREMLEFGGITVTISGENPPSKPGERSYCTAEMVEKAKYEIAKKEYDLAKKDADLASRDQGFAPRDGKSARNERKKPRSLDAGEVSDIMNSFFSGASSTSSKKPSKTAKSKKKSDEDLFLHPLGQY